MGSSLGSELVHLRCANCGRFNSLGFHSLEENNHPICPNCGSVITVDLDSAKRDAAREAHELDETEDSLGSAD